MPLGTKPEARAGRTRLRKLPDAWYFLYMMRAAFSKSLVKGILYFFDILTSLGTYFDKVGPTDFPEVLHSLLFLHLAHLFVIQFAAY